MSRIRRISPRLSRGGLLGNTEGPEAYLRELDTLPSQFCRATGGTETVIEEGDAAVSLLLNFDGSNGSTTFTDQSIYAHTVTANGNAQISTTQSKFGGSSAAFDGTGDYLTVPTNSAFDLSTSDFTIEFWLYLGRTTALTRLLAYRNGTAANTNFAYQITEESGSIYGIVYDGSNSSFVISSPLSTGQWYHIALSKAGTDATLCVNGVVADTGTFSATINNPSGSTLYVSSDINPFQGYIDSLRIIKGKALYTSNFTPLASAPTNKTGKYYRVHTFTDTDPTSLLLNFDGANGSTTFTDDSGWGHAVTANGNAQISTAQSKFGGSSLALDGSGDYLTLNGSSEFAFGSGDFTIEMWLYVTSFPNQYVDVYDARPASTDGFYPNIYLEDNGAVYFYVNSGNRISSSSGVVLTGQWHHLAVSKSGSSTKMFLDGSQIGSTYSDTNTYLNPASRPSIGTSAYTLGNNPLNGYIDSLRITKGQALYTAAFTPPTTALTRVGSGSLTFSRGGAVEYLVVGGGGGGGKGGRGGGGGAGGFLNASASVAGKSHLVSVGDGGAGASDISVTGANGSNSAAFGKTAFGGGGGGSRTALTGQGGGSGGGGGNGVGGAQGSAGAGTSGQGNAGGAGSGTATAYGAGGGGGASEVGNAGSSTEGGDGGDGSTSLITGSSVIYGGGGGGGSQSGSAVSGVGGSGGGGNGNGNDASSPSDGVDGLGGGGGGSGQTSGVTSVSLADGGSGGSGIVIVRYQITQAEYEAEAA